MVERPDHHADGTANDAFKRSYEEWFSGGLILAVILHFGLFVLARPFQAADFSGATDEFAAIELPEEARIPPPPEEIVRPAAPVVTEVELDDDPTIARTDWPSNPPERLRAPPTAGARSERPPFIPYDTPPRLTNADEVGRLLERLYPPGLKSAGVGGTVELWIHVDGRGRVAESVVKESSGHDALDRAARQVAARMVFEPAMNRDRTTAVWVSQVITFVVR